MNVFNEELIHALGITRSQVALAYFLGTATSGILLFWSGRIYDLIGSRRLMVAASLAFGLSMFYMSCVDWLPRALADGLSIGNSMVPMAGLLAHS